MALDVPADCSRPRALGALDDIGILEVGKRADVAFWRIERPAELCHGLGANPCVDVMYGGKLRAGTGASAARTRLAL